MTVAYLQSGVTVIGVGTDFEAIAAVVIGGTLLVGDAGVMLGILAGVLLRNVIQNVINLLRYPLIRPPFLENLACAGHGSKILIADGEERGDRQSTAW